VLPGHTFCLSLCSCLWLSKSQLLRPCVTRGSLLKAKSEWSNYRTVLTEHVFLHFMNTHVLPIVEKQIGGKRFGKSSQICVNKSVHSTIASAFLHDAHTRR